MLVNGEGKPFSSPNTEASIDRNVGIRARYIPQPNEQSLRAFRKNSDVTVAMNTYRSYQFLNGTTYSSPYNLVALTVDDRTSLTEQTRLNNFNISRRWT